MATSGDGPKQIPINELGVEQLNQLVKQVEGELAFFTESANSLKAFISKNDKSIVALSSMKGVSAGHQALIPLSESMYVRAELSNPSNMLIEIGTGYYAEVSKEKAVEFFERKKKYISTQLETIEKIVLEKKKARAILSDNLQQKIAAQIASLPK